MSAGELLGEPHDQVVVQATRFPSQSGRWPRHASPAVRNIAALCEIRIQSLPGRARRVRATGHCVQRSRKPARARSVSTGQVQRTLGGARHSHPCRGRQGRTRRWQHPAWAVAGRPGAKSPPRHVGRFPDLRNPVGDRRHEVASTAFQPLLPYSGWPPPCSTWRAEGSEIGIPGQSAPDDPRIGLLAPEFAIRPLRSYAHEGACLGPMITSWLWLALY